MSFKDYLNEKPGEKTLEKDSYYVYVDDTRGPLEIEYGPSTSKKAVDYKNKESSSKDVSHLEIATGKELAKIFKGVTLVTKLKESPVGQRGRTGQADAEAHVTPELQKEFMAIVKKLGGKTVARLLLNGMNSNSDKLSNDGDKSLTNT